MKGKRNIEHQLHMNSHGCTKYGKGMLVQTKDNLTSEILLSICKVRRNPIPKIRTTQEVQYLLVNNKDLRADGFHKRGDISNMPGMRNKSCNAKKQSGAM